MGLLSFKDFEVNKTFDFGFVALTEQEIIEYATHSDPLDFHTDKEAAKNSMFGGLVASGPQLFRVFHVTQWLPLFKDTILAGLELKWRFLKPIFPDVKVYGKAVIVEIKPNHEKNYATIKWHFDFVNEEGTLLQTIDMTVLHKM